MYKCVAFMRHIREVMGITSFCEVFACVMAFFQYLAEVDGDCLLSSFTQVLENAGFHISHDFSSSAQIFAECKSAYVDYKSNVKVLISWSDKSKRECSVEIRSDEPQVRRHTRCKEFHSYLSKVIPPKEFAPLFVAAEV